MQTVTRIDIAGPHAPGIVPNVFIVLTRKIGAPNVSAEILAPGPGGETTTGARVGDRDAEWMLAERCHTEMYGPTEPANAAAAGATQCRTEDIFRLIQLLGD